MRAAARRAGAYYRALLAGCQKALAVDIGWAGSGAVMLDWAVNRLWGPGVPGCFGAVAGWPTAAAARSGDAMEPFWLTGQVRSYLYSSGENRDLWQSHDPGAGHNLFWELLLGAPEGNLTGFGPKGPILGPPPAPCGDHSGHPQGHFGLYRRLSGPGGPAGPDPAHLRPGRLRAHGPGVQREQRGISKRMGGVSGWSPHRVKRDGCCTTR